MTTMGDRLIFAAAFAGALQAERKGGFVDDKEANPDGYDAWLARTAVAAAEAAVAAVEALYIADEAIGMLEEVAQDTANPEMAAAAHERWTELDCIHHAIEEYRMGDSEGGMACAYACDGVCGGHPECMTCDNNDDDDGADIILVAKGRLGQSDA